MCIYYTIKLNSSQCRFADEANGPHEWDKYVFTLCRQGERLQKHCSDSRPDQAVAGAASAQMVICPICTSLKEAEEEYERAKAAALDYSTVEYVSALLSWSVFGQ
jgi:hypothetical protein